MMKKAFAGLLILSGLWAFCPAALKTEVSDIRSQAAGADALETVSVFHSLYYGTLTQAEGSADAVFTSLPTAEGESLQITGTWKDHAFKGNCTVTFSDGHTAEVKYKQGSISGPVSVTNPDGSSQTFACTQNAPYKHLRSYDEDGTLTGTDWFYLGTPQSVWREDALSPTYRELTETPYEYVEAPVRISGTVRAIYETPRYSYLKITDSHGNLYLCKNINLRMDKYAPARIKNLSVGDQVTILGRYLGLADLTEHPISLFEHALGYEMDFEEFSPSIVDGEFFNTYRPYGLLKDEELEAAPIPELAIISGETDKETVSYDRLTNTYREICEYPFYYMDQEMDLSGTVVYESFAADVGQAVLLIRQEGSGDLYAVTWKTEQYTSLMDQKVSCSGYLNGNNKIAYLSPKTRALGYALYPNISVSEVSGQE